MKTRKLKPGIEKALIILTVILTILSCGDPAEGVSFLTFIGYEAVIWGLIGINCIVLKKYGRIFNEEA